MSSHQYVFKETGIVLLGVSILSALMVGVFALVGYYDTTVLLGAAVGAALAVLNFFAMALGTSLAADKAEKQDVKGGQALVQMSYIGRMVILFIALIVCAKSGLFHPLAMVIPLVFVRPVLSVAEIFKKKGDKAA